MLSITTRVRLLLLLLPALSIATHAQTPLASTIDSLLSAPAVSRAHWGISVVDAATGIPLYSKNEAQFFEPASNAKLFTTAAALAILGPDATVKTTVTAEGEITADCQLHGLLRLNGAGDPTLSGRVYPYSGKTERTAAPLQALDELAAQVATSGIHAVDGPVIGDDTLFPWERYGSGWAWDDLQWDYGAPVSALTVNDNVRFLSITPGAQAGAPVTLAWAPEFAFVADAAGSLTLGDTEAGKPGAGTLLNTATTSGAGTPEHLGLSREIDSPALRVYGTVPAGSKPANVAISLRDPADFAAAALRAALLAHGVAVSGTSQAMHRAAADTADFKAETHEPLAPGAGAPAISLQGRLVATHTSPPLKDIITVTNKVSQNLHAELLLHLLGRAAGADGSTAQGVRVVRSFLVGSGIDPDDFTFRDGSGLSPDDLVTPRAVTALLVYAARQPWGGVYRASLPIGGVDGSLAARFTTPALRGKLEAKTGTLGEVNALSGYLTAASGRSLVFSVIANDRVGDGARTALDKVVAAIAAAY
jgi:D-alanyl-D-alanine carboxypeptidase/D-alanyl-D-alanine-endopeptidase (penicillin-binding protein 4)